MRIRFILCLAFVILTGCTAAQANKSTVQPSLIMITSTLTAVLHSSPFVTKLILPTDQLSSTPEIIPTRTKLPTDKSLATQTPAPPIMNTPTPTDVERLVDILQSRINNTPTATLDVSKIITRTPGLPAQCPSENKGLVLNKDALFQGTSPRIEKPILEFLNQGGSLDAVLIAYDYGNWDRAEEFVFKGDVTGDNIPELIVSDTGWIGGLYILGCDQGVYRTLYTTEFEDDPPAVILAVNDMNGDGLPEILISKIPTFGTQSDVQYQIVEWNSQGFQTLLNQQGYRFLCGWDEWVCMSGQGNIQGQWVVQDIDHNGTLELIISGGVLSDADALANGLYQIITETYMWNGDEFVLYNLEMGPPQYRFQAIQDADLETLLGHYDKALDLYQQAIFSDKLDYWSKERAEQQRILIAPGEPTLTPPIPDPNEYPNLAAYARFRIMLLHFVRGWNAEAQTVYNTLQEKYPEGQIGHAYAEMAADFWNEYLISQNIGQACSKAVEYTEGHEEEILAYISSGYHGWQSREYLPQDICPFK